MLKSAFKYFEMNAAFAVGARIMLARHQETIAAESGNASLKNIKLAATASV